MEKIYTMSENLIVQEMAENEYVLVLLPKGTYFLLKETGAVIWKAISEHKNKKEIVTMLLQKYDVDYDVVLGDVNKYIETLLKEGIIKSND